MGYGLRRNYGFVPTCSSFQFQMNKKESVIREFEMNFKKSFCFGFNLRYGDIISVLCKHVMLRFVTAARFRSENGYGFYKPGALFSKVTIINGSLKLFWMQDRGFNSFASIR